MRKHSIPNLNVFAFELKNIFIDHGHVKTPARSFSKQKNVNAQLLDSNKKRKQSCRQLAEQFNIEKTAAAKIIKNEASIRKEYKLFKGNLQRKRKEQFHDINEILHTWFVNCCTANVYPDGPMLREEAKEKPLMDNPPCHPESLSDPFSNVKVVFLPKNTMSRLQPFVRNVKVRYRRLPNFRQILRGVVESSIF